MCAAQIEKCFLEAGFPEEKTGVFKISKGFLQNLTITTHKTQLFYTYATLLAQLNMVIGQTADFSPVHQ